MDIKVEKIKVYGMTCPSCENRVEKVMKKLDGVLSVKASYSYQFVEIEYVDELCSLEQIKASIENAGYTTQSSGNYKFVGILVIVAAIALLGLNTSGFDMEEKLNNASYVVIFAIGVLTSIHCIGMCGGIMISQSLSAESTNKFEAIKPSLLYNLGRVVSYTIIGGIIGALGSVFSFSIVTKAAIQIFAGIFMIIMGLNMSGFSMFRRFYIKLPNFSYGAKSDSKSPLIVGFFNGLMPCGPLQTMQLFVLGTGSAAKGALSMFIFSMGTVPLMLIFGALSGLLSKGNTKKILKFSGILIIILGLIMGNRGFVLAGIDINPLSSIKDKYGNLLFGNPNNSSSSDVAKATIENGVQIINMTADNNGFSPNAFYVQKGIPVKWIIDGKELTSCNNAIVIQTLDKEQKIKSGENIIEFNPGDKDINFSCWMGMLRGVIKVVDDLDAIDVSKPDPSLPPASKSPSCCARPVDESSDSKSSNKPSIYGDDTSQVPTEKFISKASTLGKYHSAEFKGIGYEFQPLLIVTDYKVKTKLFFNLDEFESTGGEYLIVDTTTGEEVNSFNSESKISEIELTPDKAGVYAVLNPNGILGIIEVVDDLNAVDLEEMRDKYIKK